MGQELLAHSMSNLEVSYPIAGNFSGRRNSIMIIIGEMYCMTIRNKIVVTD